MDIPQSSEDINGLEPGIYDLSVLDLEQLSIQ